MLRKKKAITKDVSIALDVILDKLEQLETMLKDIKTVKIVINIYTKEGNRE